MDWEKYGFVISSNYRKKVIISLSDGPKTPKEIADETNLYISHVSKTLSELQSVGLVLCLTPTLKRGRVYKLTTNGKEISKYIKRRTNN